MIMTVTRFGDAVITVLGDTSGFGFALQWLPHADFQRAELMQFRHRAGRPSL
jgi:hypothetical protein